MGATILVIEDDSRILSFVKRGLQAEGYAVETVQDGAAGFERARSGGFDLVVLDRMLPRMEGLEVCRRLREAGVESAILMLTAKDALQEKVDGLKGGADDYMTKPFAFAEFLARAEALLRRRASLQKAAGMSVGDLRLDVNTKTALRGDRPIQLTAKEFALLAYLMANAGAVVSRTQLLSGVWGLNFDPGTKVVDVYIRYLRKKIDDGEPKPLIQTVRGFGYMLSE